MTRETFEEMLCLTLMQQTCINGIVNYHGYIPNYYEQTSIFPNNIYPSNAPIWVPPHNVFEHQMQILSGIVNNPSVQEMEPYIEVGS